MTSRFSVDDLNIETLPSPIRQTALWSEVDANGYANYITDGGSLTLDLNADATSLILSFAAGFLNKGPSDFQAIITADVIDAWDIPDDDTSYLFIDRDPTTGAITFDEDLVAPQYLYALPGGPTAGDHVFVIPEMKMFEYNGSTWDERQRIFVGEALAASGTISSVITYALRGEWKQVPVNPAVTTTVSLNHNLGIEPRRMQVFLKCLTAELNWLVGDVIHDDHNLPSTLTSAQVRAMWGTTLSCGWRSGTSFIQILQKGTSGSFGNIVLTNWDEWAYVTRGW